jgi:hypothetical protein
MMVVFRDGGIEIGDCGVDEKMVMPAVWFVRSGWNDIDILGSEFNRDRARYSRTILWLDDENLGSSGRGRSVVVGQYNARAR